MKKTLINLRTFAFASLLLVAVLFSGCYYDKDVTLRFEGNDTYRIEKWVWYSSDAICMQFYEVKTKNIDSLYQATLDDCDTIIARHKRALQNSH